MKDQPAITNQLRNAVRTTIGCEELYEITPITPFHGVEYYSFYTHFEFGRHKSYILVRETDAADAAANESAFDINTVSHHAIEEATGWPSPLIQAGLAANLDFNDLLTDQQIDDLIETIISWDGPSAFLGEEMRFRHDDEDWLLFTHD